MAYVLVKNSDQTVISPIAAHESAGTGETKRELADAFSGSIYIGGRVSLVSGKVSAIADPNALTTAQSRREEIRQWLISAEREPIANWGLRANAVHRDRSRNAWWWLEMICTAAQKDANLTNSTRWLLIDAEMAWEVRRWYDEHVEAEWDGMRSTAAFYSTDTDGGQSAPRTMDMSGTQTLAEFLA